MESHSLVSPFALAFLGDLNCHTIKDSYLLYGSLGLLSASILANMEVVAFYNLTLEAIVSLFTTCAWLQESHKPARSKGVGTQTTISWWEECQDYTVDEHMV